MNEPGNIAALGRNVPGLPIPLRGSADEKASALPIIDVARLSAEALEVKRLPHLNPEVLAQWYSCIGVGWLMEDTLKGSCASPDSSL